MRTRMQEKGRKKDEEEMDSNSCGWKLGMG